MVYLLKTVVIGLVASAAQAASIHHEKKHGHKHHHKKVGCSNSTMPIINGTAPVAVSGTASPSVVAVSSTPSVVTVSVIPVPVSSSSASVAAVSSAASAPAGSCGGVATSTVTVQRTITVTAAGPPPSTTLTPVAVSSTKTKSKKPCSVVSSSSSSSSIAVVVPTTSIVPEPMPTSTVPKVVPSTTVVSSSVPATSSAAPVTSVGSGPYKGPKMGISWDPNQNYDLTSVGLSVPPSWAYDWGQQAHGVPSGVQYVPSVHDGSKCAGMASDLAGSGATYVKHFNEPDQTGSGGSGLSVGAAVSLHNQYLKPLAGQYLLGLPAVTSNNIAGVSGTGWLTSFVQELGSCADFKFADFHFYGGGEDAATQATIFMSYVENWISTVDKICPGQNLPIWISEFSATPVGDSALATAFMKIVGPQLDSNPRVGRYAYWFPSNNMIESVINEVLSAVGL